MPLVKVHLFQPEGTSPELLAEVSYDMDETLAQLRMRLDKLHCIHGPYQFWSVGVSRRIPVLVETNNRVSDYSEIFVMLNPFSSTGIGQVSSHEKPLPETCGSSSQWQTTQDDLNLNLESDPVQDSMLDPDPEFDVGSDPVSDPGLQSTPSQEFEITARAPWWCYSAQQNTHFEVEKLSDFSSSQHGSMEMSPTLHKQWCAAVKRFVVYMKKGEFPDTHWTAVTWDEPAIEDGVLGKVAQAAIVCLECHFVGPVTKPGIRITSEKILACFMNFRSSHLKAAKHLQAVTRKRARPVDDASLSIPPSKKAKDDRVDVENGMDIVRSINVEVAMDPAAKGEQETFCVRGDSRAVPCVATDFTVFCPYCAKAFSLVPKQNNLKFNLRQHARSNEHKKNVEQGSVPLRTGQAGRPPKIDGRDRKQKGIVSFFRTTRRTPPEENEDAGMVIDTSPGLSKLCWGFRWRSFKGRDVSKLLLDRMQGSEWESELLTSGVVVNEETGDKQYFRGTFRHVNCSRVSILGGGFELLICEHCYRIPLQNDFRKRVAREASTNNKRGTRSPTNGTRIDYLQPEELEKVVRVGTQRSAVLRKTVRSLQKIVARVQAKPPPLKILLGDAVENRNIFKFCQTVVSAHKDGAFGGKPALWSLINDLVVNVSRDPRGHRWSKPTKFVMQALLQHGGHRVIDCFYGNIGGPSVSTLMRDRKGMVDFRTGLNPKQFQFIAKVYQNAKKVHGIEGDVPVILAEDETSVKRSVR